MIKKAAAVAGSSLLLGLVAYIGTAVPASASHGGQYQVCNSGNSVTALYAANDLNGDYNYVQQGSTSCQYVSNGAGGLRIDPDREAGNINDADSYRLRPDDGSPYGYWHNNESIINPPDAWEHQGIWVQTDDVTH